MSDAQSITAVPMWIDLIPEACNNHEAGFHFEEGGCFGFAIALHQALSQSGFEPQYCLHQGAVHAAVHLGSATIDHQGQGCSHASSQYVRHLDLESIKKAAQTAGCNTDQIDADVDWAREILQSARKLACDSLAWPQCLDNEREIASHMASTASDEVDTRMIEECFFGAKAVLVRIATEEIVIDPQATNNNTRSSKKERAYLKMPAQTSPPTVIDENATLQDGHHRHRVAIQRKDPWMLAYMMVSPEVDLQPAKQPKP